MTEESWQGVSFESIDLRLCTSCGTCIGACPVQALAWRDDETIFFDRAKCIDCGICYAVCPPESPLDIQMVDSAQGGEAIVQDNLIGPYRSLSRAHAADPIVRAAGSAGGVATALLLSALEQGVINGAVVVQNDASDPTRPKLAVARTPEEIRAAAQSKYCLAPANVLLGQIPKGIDRLGLVALPCQAHGFQLARALNLGIARRVAIVIGVFCGVNMRYEGTTYLLHKLGIRPEEVATLEHRGGAWPGGFRVVTHDGREAFIAKHECAYVHFMHAPQGCWYCPDLTAEFADISVGDYWAGDERGHSMVIGRTAAGQALLDAATVQGRVSAKAIPYDEVLASHHHLLRYKKLGVQVRRSLSRCKPVEAYRLPSLTARDRISSALFYAFLRVSSSRLGRTILGVLPLGIAGLVSSQGRAMFRRAQRHRP